MYLVSLANSKGHQTSLFAASISSAHESSLSLRPVLAEDTTRLWSNNATSQLPYIG